MTRAHNKTAVDSTAKEYWSEYFGPYGDQFTRDVIRKVAAAVSTRMRRAGSLGDEPSDLRLRKASVTPIGAANTATGGLTFEGVFSASGTANGKPYEVRQAFAATFDARVNLVDLETLAA